MYVVPMTRVWEEISNTTTCLKSPKHVFRNKATTFSLNFTTKYEQAEVRLAANKSTSYCKIDIRTYSNF